MGGSFGAGNYGMCGRAFSPRMLWMWCVVVLTWADGKPWKLTNNACLKAQFTYFSNGRRPSCQRACYRQARCDGAWWNEVVRRGGKEFKRWRERMEHAATTECDVHFVTGRRGIQAPHQGEVRDGRSPILFFCASMGRWRYKNNYFTIADLWWLRNDVFAVIAPEDTRDTLGLALSAAMNKPIEDTNFGVFRMVWWIVDVYPLLKSRLTPLSMQ